MFLKNKKPNSAITKPPIIIPLHQNFREQASNYRKKAFTLIELLIVIGILAVLATVVLLVLNPAQMVKQTRDANRLTELNQINQALQIYESFGGTDLGTHNTVYVSLPSSQANCSDLGLPALGGGYVYACSNSTNYRKTDGTGWIPVNLTTISSQAGNLFAALPIDPINTVANGYYYTYIPGSWALSATMESIKFQEANAAIDGGLKNNRFEIGNNLSLIANFAAAEGAICGNNIVEGGETCDGSDLNSKTCATQLGAGYTGTLSCNSGCSAFVTTSCVAPWACGDTLIDTRDSKTYTTVQIGTQCWFAKNLAYDDGCTAITWVNSTDVGWCGYYTGGPFTNEGLLYQWSAAMDGSTSAGAQGLCPTGWHVPTDAEYKTLETYFGMCAGAGAGCVDASGLRGTDEGTDFRSVSGFNLLFAGYRNYNDGAYTSRGSYTFLWTSLGDSSDAWSRLLSTAWTTVWRGKYGSASYGFSVRCLKN